jgi:hypothetical protein
MSGAILPLPQYAFMAWCSVKAQGDGWGYVARVSEINAYNILVEKSGGKGSVGRHKPR